MGSGFELVHIGLNTADEQQARETAKLLALLFDLEVREGQKSIFAGGYFECMRAPYLGAHGHIAMCAEDLAKAMETLREKGFAFRMETAAYDPNGRIMNVYLAQEVAGFAIHILQKKN